VKNTSKKISKYNIVRNEVKRKESEIDVDRLIHPAKNISKNLDSIKLTSMDDVLGFILSSGVGSRLWPLTSDRTKSAVPFAGNLRIIDFVLTNFMRSGIKKIYITIYYKSDSLRDHIFNNWNFLPSRLGEFIKLLPPQRRTGHDTYGGSANALYQNKHLIEHSDTKTVAVFSADHIFYMDIRQMMHFHQQKNSDCTVCAIPIRTEDLHRDSEGRIPYGVIITDRDNKITGFEEKPKKPNEIFGKKGYFWASMGNYLFERDVLVNALIDDNSNSRSSNDFGHDILPMLIKQKKNVYMYDFSNNTIPGMKEHERGFWMDVGMIDSYYQTSMMLLGSHPKIDLYNQWALMRPPAKTMNYPDADSNDSNHAMNTLISLGVIIKGSDVENSIIFSNVKINSYSHIKNSIIFDDVEIGSHCHVMNCIIDKNVIVPDNTTIGYDIHEDKRRGFYISANGIVVVPKRYSFSKHHHRA